MYGYSSGRLYQHHKKNAWLSLKTPNENNKPKKNHGMERKNAMRERHSNEISDFDFVIVDNDADDDDVGWCYKKLWSSY